MKVIMSILALLTGQSTIIIRYIDDSLAKRNFQRAQVFFFGNIESPSYLQFKNAGKSLPHSTIPTLCILWTSHLLKIPGYSMQHVIDVA